MARGYGWLPGSFGYEMVAQVRKLKDAAYAAGVPVIHVNSMRRPTDHVPNQTMMVDTPALEIIPELHPIDKDIVICKRYLGGFTHNDLDYTLRTMGIKKVILAGASTHNCVLWTAAGAFERRYGVVVVEDCTIVHREQGSAEAKADALRIIRGVLHGDVLPLSAAIEKYLPPQ
jgi:nicotinamidase-related amidase